MTDTKPVAAVLDDLAPYPDPHDMTLESLARWFTARSFASYTRLAEHPYLAAAEERDTDGKPSGTYRHLHRDFLQLGELAWTQYAAAVLLRGVGRRSSWGWLCREADTAELASESVGEWLVEHGIDPEVIVQAVRAEQAANL